MEFTNRNVWEFLRCVILKNSLQKILITIIILLFYNQIDLTFLLMLSITFISFCFVVINIILYSKILLNVDQIFVALYFLFYVYRYSISYVCM